ncbi:bone morphogenetic protein 2-A isoform X2 [Cylas formicarius]|uniref:bone morphogenetic protein 2-A isoform X2 n=1 Tax=Cylas formicarius TaxID=197179 RepID=UPI002958A941|nr:bone morphogenetic protein 2-A isoform X2 [Cylas formicarius]
MLPSFAIFCALLLHQVTLAIGSNVSGTSYFFKTNGNNEFRVYNRIHYLNHNITDMRYNPHPANVKMIKAQPAFREPKKTLYLDNEWDYDHKKTNLSDLPHFVPKFYEQHLSEANQTRTIRILFNENRNATSPVVKFNLASLVVGENVSDADLYFYWPLENTSSVFKTSVVLKLYQIEHQLSNDLNETAVWDNPDLHKLFNIIYVSKAHKGWQTFKIKKPIDNWLNGEVNLGLLLTISSYDDNQLVSVFNDTNAGIFRTFAVVKMTPENGEGDAPDGKKSRLSGLNDRQPSADGGTCTRRDWYVDFDQLRWNDFIIRPLKGFNAYECVGKCDLDDPHASNHVRLRATSRSKSCCAVAALSAVPIMFYDRHGNVAMKNYAGAVAEECSCR